MKKPVRNANDEHTERQNEEYANQQGRPARFKVTDPDAYAGYVIGRYLTLEEVYNAIRDEDSARLGYWHIEDVDDSIWIHSDELINAWEQGERYEDLQGF